MNFSNRSRGQVIDFLEKSITCPFNLMKTSNPSPTQGVTLIDIFKALEKKKHKNARFKLRQLCLDNNINTLDDFLKLSPSEFKTYRNIGTTTVYQVREVIESFGIVWSDAK